MSKRKNKFKEKLDLIQLELKLKPVLMKADNNTLRGIIGLCGKILDKRK